MTKRLTSADRKSGLLNMERFDSGGKVVWRVGGSVAVIYVVITLPLLLAHILDRELREYALRGVRLDRLRVDVRISYQLSELHFPQLIATLATILLVPAFFKRANGRSARNWVIAAIIGYLAAIVMSVGVDWILAQDAGTPRSEAAFSYYQAGVVEWLVAATFMAWPLCLFLATRLFTVSAGTEFGND